MADKKITVCDRCGKEIAYKVFPVMTGRIDHAIKFGFGDYEYIRNTFDLCRGCTKSFERFMDGERDGDE